MKPRIFVSSTFYDLKHMREDLSSFIKSHDFEPVLFEDGDVGYTPGRALDDSCYETMRTCDIVLLIIGGQYGSPATGEIKDEFNEYMSVTRREFKEAVKEAVPLYTFIESKVFAEFEIYEENYERIEIEKDQIKFRNTKNINVFRFIREIKGIGNITLIEFNKVTDIKDFLNKQWSDMFKRYLDYLKEKESDRKVGNTIDEMKTLIQKMDIMLDSVGKKVLTDGNNKDYDEVIMQQAVLDLCHQIASSFDLQGINVSDSLVERKQYIKNLLDALEESFNSDIWTSYGGVDNKQINIFIDFFKKRNINIYGVFYGFGGYSKNFLSIIADPKRKQMVIDELVKDAFYIRMKHDLSEH